MKTLDQDLPALNSKIEQAANQTLLQAGQIGQDAARNTTLFRNQGTLRQATNFHPISQFSGFVLADTDYADYLESGNPSEGFTIRPKNAKVLHFRINGQDIFTKTAKAHGPLPFMLNAQKEVEKEIQVIWEHNFDQAVKGD